jgi:hypothetical protein
MVLTIDLKRRLLEKISRSPCSIQELAFEFEKNWRTIDNYIGKLVDEGLVCIKEFKKGSRVAFKIVFIQPEINFQISDIQKQILKKIESGQRSQNFSPLNIIQHIDENEFKAYFKSTQNLSDSTNFELANFLKQATQNILMFSGDLSWVNLKIKTGSLLDTIEDLARRKISIKIIARVDKNTQKIVDKLLNINYKLGYEMIEIHHEEHPLRCFVIDGKIARLKEPSFSSEKGNLKKIGTYFYMVFNESWINWFERLFWSMFRTSIPASKRIKVLDKIEELKS